MSSNQFKSVLAATSHWNERPAGSLVDSIIIHSLSHPDLPERVPTHTEALALLNAHSVSAHALIDARGGVLQTVPHDKRAWHAGVSTHLDGRTGVNDFSLGVELLTDCSGTFTKAQYLSLSSLCQELARIYPIRFILGHEDIAQPPGRKVDPGPGFDWEYFSALVNDGWPGANPPVYPHLNASKRER